MKLYSKQGEFLQSTAPIKAFIAGRGAGKTIAGGTDLVVRALKTPATYLAVATTYRSARDIMVPAIQAAGGGELRTTDMSLAVGSSKVLIRSIDQPDKIRGISVAGCWWDEAAQSKTADTMRIILGCLRWQGTMGWLTITTTPRKGWLREALSGAYIVRASSFNNPFVSLDFVQQMAAQYPEDWRKQEIEGLFVDSLTMFKKQWFAHAAAPLRRPCMQCRGWDLARTEGNGDHLAGVKMQAGEDGKVMIVDVVREQKAAQGVVDLMQLIAMRDGPETVQVIEQEMGASGALFVESMRKTLRPLGLRVEPAAVKGGKILRALRFAAAAEKGEVSILDAAWTEATLIEFDDFDGSDGGVDDVVDAGVHAYNYIDAHLTRLSDSDTLSITDLQIDDLTAKIEQITAGMSDSEILEAEKLLGKKLIR